MKSQTYTNLLGETINLNEAKKKANPLIRAYGKGPEGEKCRTCKHLYGKSYSKTYYKCDLRSDSNGPGTDHKVNWPACGQYEKKV